mmetsp:Transcript_21253/g.49285  ORF Transcript_21253/g.49285 Transcript_21253/m.49285 type:complete len:249 (-) Transcript_21253:615-1361(-)
MHSQQGVASETLTRGGARRAISKNGSPCTLTRTSGENCAGVHPSQHTRSASSSGCPKCRRRPPLSGLLSPPSVCNTKPWKGGSAGKVFAHTSKVLSGAEQYTTSSGPMSSCQSCTTVSATASISKSGEEQRTFSCCLSISNGCQASRCTVVKRGSCSVQVPEESVCPATTAELPSTSSSKEHREWSMPATRCTRTFCTGSCCSVRTARWKGTSGMAARKRDSTASIEGHMPVNSLDATQRTVKPCGAG